MWVFTTGNPFETRDLFPFSQWLCSLLGVAKIEGRELQPDFGFSGGLIIVYPDYNPARCLAARIFTEELSCWNIYSRTLFPLRRGTNELRTYNRITTVTDFGVDLRLIAMTATGVQNSKSQPFVVGRPSSSSWPPHSPPTHQSWVVVVNWSEVQSGYLVYIAFLHAGVIITLKPIFGFLFIINYSIGAAAATGHAAIVFFIVLLMEWNGIRDPWTVSHEWIGFNQ